MEYHVSICVMLLLMLCQTECKGVSHKTESQKLMHCYHMMQNDVIMTKYADAESTGSRFFVCSHSGTRNLTILWFSKFDCRSSVHKFKIAFTSKETPPSNHVVSGAFTHSNNQSSDVKASGIKVHSSCTFRSKSTETLGAHLKPIWKITLSCMLNKLVSNPASNVKVTMMEMSNNRTIHKVKSSAYAKIFGHAITSVEDHDAETTAPTGTAGRNLNQRRTSALVVIKVVLIGVQVLLIVVLICQLCLLLKSVSKK